MGVLSVLARTQVNMKTFIILLACVALSLSQKKCSYKCDGWPYEQCKLSTRYATATCINPFTSRSSSQIYSNYPECADIPSGCQRCDDLCSKRDGNKDKLDYKKSGPGTPPPIAIFIKPEPPVEPEDPDCAEIKGRRVCCSDDGECSEYSGPDPTPEKRAKFTTCQYSDGYLRCEFSDDCSEIRNRMICCEENGKCSGYDGANPRDRFCSFDDGYQVCA